MALGKSAGSPPRRAAFAPDARAVSAYAAAKAAWWVANGVLVRQMVGPTKAGPADAPPPDAPSRRRAIKTSPTNLKALRQAWLGAFRQDAADVAAGLYPATEAPEADPAGAFRRALDFLKDAQAVDRRRRRRDGTEARGEAGAGAYPAYYRQNFHYQSGGWFTDESARRYETQVEALFSGAAGPMRRRALSLLAKAFRARDQRGLKLLDIACGSGAFLVDLKAAFPRAAIMGLDLSPAYLKEAERRSCVPCVQGLAERLPFADASLDGVSCVFLFHELPPRIRPLVAAEIARVLKPGGVLAFADSVQAADAPEIARLLEAFPAFFHEPYYESYQACDLVALFTAAGLHAIGRDQAFLTKALAFRKPHLGED